MKNRMVLTFIVLVILTACTPQKKVADVSQDMSHSLNPNVQSSETGDSSSDSQSTGYTGDGSHLLTAWVRETGECVKITKDGEIVYHFPNDITTYEPIGGGMIYERGIGAIDFQGKVVFEKDFENIGFFVDGLAPASVMVDEERLYGFIDTSGEFVIEPQFWAACSFSEGLAPVAFVGSKSLAESDWGYINKSGEIVLRDFDDATPFSEGVAAVKPKDKELYGYIRPDGSYVIEPAYQYAFSFSEGLAAVAEPTEDFADRKFGYIDHTGKYVLQPVYGSAGDFCGGVAGVTFGDYTDSRYKMIDKNGTVLLDKTFISFSILQPDVIGVQERETLKKYFMDRTGAEILSEFTPLPPLN